MTDAVPPNPSALEEALELSEHILADIELDRIPLSSVALKATRLARILNDRDHEMAFTYEASGYPMEAGVIPFEAWLLTELAGRRWSQVDIKTGEKKEYAYVESISQLEDELDIAKRSFDAARDPNISMQSANPYQYVSTPTGNYMERQALRNQASLASQRLSARRAFIHRYTSNIHYQLKFSGVASEVFSRLRNRVDSSIAELVPDAVKRLTAIHDNLRSENPENWSNAAHGCRRLLRDLADAVFPARPEPRVTMHEGKEVSIALGPENFINRIMCFVENSTGSTTATAIIGSDLRFLGDRLDAVVGGAQKGSHTDIVTREEADRIVLHSYMIIGEVLTLRRISESATPSDA